MQSLLDVSQLTVDFRSEEGLIRAVDDIHLSVHPGEIVGLVGESGSGKSVTSKTIMRLMPSNALVHSNSRVMLHHNNQDYNVLKLKGKQLNMVHGGVVSMIFQEPMASFAPAIRIGEQIIETIQIHLGKSRDEARKIGIGLFERVGIPMPEQRFDQYVFELSGGMRQRAMIAMALSTQPKLLIADEPTTALDVTIQAQVLDLMLELREQLGMAMIFITHDLGVISKVADNVTVLKKGRVVEAGRAETVLRQPQHAYTQQLLDALPHINELPPPPKDAGDPFVRIENLNIYFPMNSGGRHDKRQFHAVKDINLTLPKGRIIGLVGESGSGKTTLGKALLGATPISSGTIAFLGDQPLQFNHPKQIKRKTFARIGQMIFQDPHASLNPRMTVRDIIAEPLEALKLCKDKAEIDARVKAIAARCHIEISHLRRFPHAFSGGQRQRISIARALICEPQFIVADESVAALDVSTQAEILKLLKSLRDEMGLTILFISHDLSVIANLCDHVVVIRHGELVEQGSVRDIFLQPQAAYTQQLIHSIPMIDPLEPCNTSSNASVLTPALNHLHTSDRRCDASLK
ncbi:dipeptide ABC transporter ATP-binding protein [Ostreibacterium oceani]|uniref:ABC-type dipeptide transporter n=1 Tax=Ostreibacterium oceani TaxID=2654998 RepID=A0A6N7F2A0_9GAMM|nr:ABC transporter ATP-binding protein [Ostreibacterium oceani]MPV85996.1 dipeptide ABC transporter ATP-binding protein [Ostreibacterium oceani]